MKDFTKTLGILFLTFNFIILSDISNAQWTVSSNGITGGVNITSLAVSGTNIFAGSSGEGIYLSTNSGSSWTAVNNGLTQLSVYALAVSGTTIFAGTLNGVFISTNNGLNWSPSTSGIEGIIRTFAVAGTSIYAGGNTGVFLSGNNGGSWTELVNGLPNLFAATALAASASGVFAGEDNTGSGVPGGIYKSTNGGSNWSLAVNGLINGNVRCLAISGSNVFAGTSAGIYVSTNEGNNWTPANGNLAGLYYINTLFISGPYVFTGTNPLGGLFMTTNNGTNWLDKNSGFSGAQYVYSINTANNYIFAAKYHSVWRRQYSEIIGIQNISSEIPEDYSLSQNYPNPFNPETSIEFSISKAGKVSLKVFDAGGKEVQKYVDTYLQSGTYKVEIDGTELPSGTYFYELTAGKFRKAKMMILIK